MKYRDYIFMTMAALLLLSACAEEVEVARSGQLPSLYGGKEPYTGTDVTFTVYDSFDPTGTRAAVNGYETTFENGDAIGVYTVTPQGVVRAANVKVTFNGTTWAPATKIVNSPDLIYYAYYPYQASPAGPPAANATVTAGVGADEFFKLLVAKWEVKHDQSTKANYNASDLCISRSIATKSNADGSGEVAFTLDHKMALAVLTLKPKTVTLTTKTVYNYFDKEDAANTWTETSTSTNSNYLLPASTVWGTSTFAKPTAWNSAGTVTSTTNVTVTNKPYRPNVNNDVYYFIARPITNFIIKATSGGSTDVEKGAWSQQVAVASGRYDNYEPTITDGDKTQTVNVDPVGMDVTLNVGDYYYTDGTSSPTLNPAKKVLGIIAYSKPKGGGTTVVPDGYKGLVVGLLDFNMYQKFSYYTSWNGVTDYSRPIKFSYTYTLYWDTRLTYDMMSGEYWMATDENDDIFPNITYGSAVWSDYKGYEKMQYIYNEYTVSTRPATYALWDGYYEDQYWDELNYWFSSSKIQPEPIMLSGGQWYEVLKACAAKQGYTVTINSNDGTLINGGYGIQYLNSRLQTVPGAMIFSDTSKGDGNCRGYYFTSTERNESSVWILSLYGANIVDVPVWTQAKMGLDYETSVRPFFIVK